MRNRMLFEIARGIATGFSQRAVRFRKEAHALEARLAEIGIRLVDLERAGDRLTSFEPHRNGALQCPYCWMQREESATLRPAAPDSEQARLHDDDATTPYVCGRCLIEIALPH